MIFGVIYTIGLLVSGCTGALLWKRLSGWGFWERAGAVLLTPALLTTAALFFLKIKDALYYDQNWERLQTAFALALGHPIYHYLNEGAILNTIYGPLSIMAYLPATLAKSPTMVMTIAASLTAVYFFLPVFWLHMTETFASVQAVRDEHEERRQLQLFTLLALVTFVSIVFLSSSLRNPAFHVHADAPALGLGVMACGFVCLRKKKNEPLSLPLSALTSVFAVWTKQVMAPLPVAIAFYLLMSKGIGVFLRYALYFFVFGLLVSGICIYFFNFSALVLNLITIPSRHPLREAWLSHSAWKLFRECLLTLGIALFSIGPILQRQGRNPLKCVRDNRWTLFLIVALLLTPTSLWGYGKIGGSNNTLGYACYFFLLAVTFAFVESLLRERAARALLIGMAALYLLIQIPCVYYRNFHSRDKPNYAQIVYDYIKMNPGKAYFPYLNVLHILAEKKVYHAGAALMDRKWANLPVRPEHLRAHLPEHMGLIAFRRGHDDGKRWLDLPEFRAITKDPALPGFKVYRRRKP